MTQRSVARISGDEIASHYTHDSGVAGLGTVGITGQPDVEKRQSLRSYNDLAGRNGGRHAEGYAGGLIETMNGA